MSLFLAFATMQLDSSQSQKLFDAGGFLILPLEQQGQEFGIDGSVWAVKSFAVRRPHASPISARKGSSVEWI